MSLQQEADERRKRIAQLRAQRKGASSKETEEEVETPTENKETTPPVYESHGETVEVLANDIQERIFAKSRQIASMARDPQLKEDENDSVGTQDLKLALQDQFDTANVQTDRAINTYLQNKYRK